MKKLILISCSLILSACAETRSPPISYPDKCGSHVECFNLSLKSLDEARKKYEQAQHFSEKSVPIGTVAAYSGKPDDIELNGWMICDGRSLDKNNKKYAELFNLIGVTYGGDASPFFKIPDYRGLFLRGLDQGTKRDPDAGVRISTGTPSPVILGDKIGSYQDDALQTHQHNISYQLSATGSNNTNDVDSGSDKKNSSPNAGQITIRVLDPIGAKTSAENRPKNVSVYWIIKFQ